MDITAISNSYGNTPVSSTTGRKDSVQGFDSMLSSAMSLIKDTNSLQEAASAEEVAFALGETDNTHDLMIAEQKANIALQYTVAVRDRLLESYNTIMNLQI